MSDISADTTMKEEMEEKIIEWINKDQRPIDFQDWDNVVDMLHHRWKASKNGRADIWAGHSKCPAVKRCCQECIMSLIRDAEKVDCTTVDDGLLFKLYDAAVKIDFTTAVM